MAFGKRLRPQAVAQRAPEPPTPGSTSSRYTALQDQFLELFAAAAAITHAIQNDGTIHVRSYGSDIQPDAGPISLMGFAEHFVVESPGQMLYPFFVYVSPARPEHLDPSAQFQIHDLITKIRNLNVYCQRAAADDALAMALHGPEFPERIDRLLVGTAYFVAFFENLAQTQPFVSGPATDAAQPDFTSLKARLDGRLLMAEDRMLVPKRIAEFVPGHAWPHLGVEVLRRREAGQELVDGVYFPADLARQLAARRDRTATALAEADTVLFAHG